MRELLTITRWKLLTYVLGMGVTTIIVLALAQRRPLTNDARAFVQAVVTGDGATLYRLSYDREKRLLGLTPEKVTRFLKEILLPEMRGLQVVSAKPWADRADAREACVEVRLEGPPARFHVMTLCVYRTPAGGRAMISGLIFDAWTLRYLVNKGLPVNWKGRHEAALKGISADRQRLLSMGLAGYVPVPQLMAPAPKVRTWEEVAASSREKLKKYEQAAQPAASK